MKKKAIGKKKISKKKKESKAVAGLAMLASRFVREAKRGQFTLRTQQLINDIVVCALSARLEGLRQLSTEERREIFRQEESGEKREYSTMYEDGSKESWIISCLGDVAENATVGFTGREVEHFSYLR